MYKLSDDDTGLHCTANGVTYGGIALVAKAGKHFQPCQPEIDSLTRAGLTISPGGLQTIANFLNKGELGLAMIGALHLRLPDLEAMRIAKAGYDPNQPRDDHGMWTSEDNDGSKNTASTSPSRTQYADSGQIMTDTSPDGPNKPAVPVKGTSGLDIDKAVQRLDTHAAENKGSTRNCASYVESALSAGGIDLPRPTALAAAKDKGSLLLNAGFVQVATDKSADFVPKKGDVVVIQSYPGGSVSGHMAMFDGIEWVSDYHQGEGTDPYPGSHYQRAAHHMLYTGPKVIFLLNKP